MLQKILHITTILLVVQAAYAQGLQTFDDLLHSQFTKSDSIQIQILDARKAYIEKDKGLKLNSTAGTNEFGDLETGNIFRIKAGFEWNILDEGFMDHKITGKLLDVEKEIKIHQLREETLDDNYDYLYNHIIYSFNKEKLRFLEEKTYLLDILSKRYEALYHNHAAEYQDLLSIYDKAEEIKILLLSIRNYNWHFENTSKISTTELMPSYLPIVNIDVEKLLSYQIQDTTFETLQELKLEKNILQDRLESQKRLAVYNNVYWRPLQDVGSDRFLYNGIGLRFSTGLANRKKERQKIDDLNDELDIQKNDEKNFRNQKELSNYVLEYHLKLRIYSRFRFKLRSLQEEKRLDHAVKLVNYTDPQSDLKSLNIDLEKLSVEYELLEIKQQLYLLLLKIYKYSNVESILPFLKERDFDGVEKKLKGERILEIKSAYETGMDHGILSEYLYKNEISSVIFKGNISENREFIKTLASKDIQVYTGTEAFIHKTLVEVPMDQFTTRINMEYWINDFHQIQPEASFLIKNLNQLIQIDSAVLEK